MKFFLQTIICFAFVAVVLAQGGYGRSRRRRPRPVFDPNPIVHNPPFTSSGEAFDPMFGQRNVLDNLRGGGMGAMPDEIRRIIGRTISGNAIVGGTDGFPRHGGVLNPDGLVNGWGANPNEQVVPEVTMWRDPLNGAGFPEDYSGQELVFDPVTNRYVVKTNGAVGHQVAKGDHIAVKTGGVPSIHNTVTAGHNIVKEANHVERKTVAGVPGALSPVGTIGARGQMTGPFGSNHVIGHDNVKSAIHHDTVKSTGMIAAGKPPMGHGVVNSAGTVNAGHIGFDDPNVISHNIGKATLGSDAVAGHNIAKSAGVPVGVGFINPRGPIAAEINHDIAKSTSVVGGGQFGVGLDPFGQMTSDGFFPGNPVVSPVVDPVVNHGLVKSGRHVGVSQLGTVNAGHVGIDAPEVIAHNVRIATLGVDAVAGHNIAKASGPPVGLGFINPSGPVASQIGHDIAKETSGVIVDPFHPVNHEMSAGGIGLRPVGTVGNVGILSDPVHRVNKIGHSGIASRGHDELVGTLGHGIAKTAVSEAAHAVDLGSRGGVRARDPAALAATQGLAQESLHVAGKTMDLASSGIARGRPVAAGMNIFGQGSMMVHPQPVKKPLPKITGYGRRRPRG